MDNSWSKTSSEYSREYNKVSNVEHPSKISRKTVSTVESSLRLVISEHGGITMDQDESEYVDDEQLSSSNESVEEFDIEAAVRKSVKEIYKKVSVRELFSEVDLSPIISEEKCQRGSTNQQEIDTNCLLSPLEAIGIASVLEGTIDQLGILKYILPGSTLSWNHGYQNLKERFGGEDKRDQLFPSEADEPVLTELHKIQRDRTFVESALRSTVNNLISTNTFESLQETVDTIKQMKLEEDELILEMKDNADETNRLRNLLSNDLTDTQNQLNSRAEMIVLLKDRLHDEVVRSQMEYRYVERWQKARESQNQINLNNKEHEVTNNITNIQRGIDQENRCNSEIEHFILQRQRELEELIDVWMERYDEQTEAMEGSLLKAKMNRETNSQDFNQLQIMFKEHQEEIDDWLAIKAQRRAVELRNELLDDMACRIQTWWRAMMFLHSLGPFRKAKKDQGKGKGGKGKKGGKKK